MMWHSLTYHDTLGQIGLSNDNCTKLSEDFYEKRIGARFRKRTTYIAQGRVQSFHIELILERDWYAMQRTRQTTMLLLELIKILGLLYGVLKVDLGKTIRLI
jgi:hypothetical protein